MNHTSNFFALVAIAAAMFVSTTCFAHSPWIAGLDMSAIAQKASQPEGVTFTSGDGHVIVDFSEAAAKADLQAEFVDPLGEDGMTTEQVFYDIASPNPELKACLKWCENNVADPDEYADCVENCWRTYGGAQR